jgi:hypothetical protein
MGRFEDRDPNWEALNSDKKPKLVINHALTVARTELAKLTKSRPIMDVIANSDEEKDISAAKVGSAALDACEWRFKLNKKRKQALWWMIQCGIGAVYVGYDHYDDSAGYMEYVIDPLTGSPTFDKARKAELQQLYEDGEIDNLVVEKYALGECEYKVYSPFQLLPDEFALDFNEIKDLITVDVVNIDELKSMYGRSARDVKPDADAVLGVMEQRAIMRAGISGGIDQDKVQLQDGVKVYTFWCLPGYYNNNSYLKNGKYFRWCNGNVILDESDAFPYADGRMPFVFFSHVPSAASIWPDSVMTHIRGPNLEIDKTISQLIENKDYMSNPMWRIATQHRIKGDIKNVAGGMVRYRHVPNVPPPEPIEGLQMPPQVENLLTGLRAQILDISGQSEVARGRVPTGVRSGVAVAYLQEEDDSKIAPTIEDMEEAVALMGSLTLARFSQFYTTQRILRYYRRDGLFDVLKFKGADLRNNTDVVAQSGSAMPKSKAARQQYTLELVSLGILRDPDKIEAMLELGQGEPSPDEKAKSQAKRENNYMRHGMPDALYKPEGDITEETKNVATAVPVERWHNHELHIQIHTDEMLAEEWDKLRISQPEIVQLFNQHIAMHQQFLQEQLQQQMMVQMAMKGSPDGPPGQTGGNGQPTSFRQISQVPDVIGGGSQDISAMTMRDSPQ